MSEPVKVLIEVRNGCVVSVKSGVPLDLIVVDHDDLDPREGDAILGRTFSDDTFIRDFIYSSSTQDQY